MEEASITLTAKTDTELLIIDVLGLQEEKWVSINVEDLVIVRAKPPRNRGCKGHLPS